MPKSLIDQHKFLMMIVEKQAKNERIRYNAYEILNVDANASAAQIKKAYHELARIYHPDKIGVLNKKLREQNHAVITDSELTTKIASLINGALQAINNNDPIREANSGFTNFSGFSASGFGGFPRSGFGGFPRSGFGFYANNFSGFPSSYSFGGYFNSNYPAYINALKSGDINCLNNLYASGDIVIDGNAGSKNNFITINAEAILTALENNQIAVMHWLINKGVNINKPFRVYSTVLGSIAQDPNATKILNLLLADELIKHDIGVLNNAIRHTKIPLHNAALKAYRAKHFRYNPFKFGYNNTWTEHVDTSWRTTIAAQPNNIKIVLNDLLSVAKTTLKILLSWEFLVFLTTTLVLLSAIMLFLYCEHHLLSLIPHPVLREALFVVSWGLFYALGLASVEMSFVFYSYAVSYLHTNVDPLLATVHDYVHALAQKIYNTCVNFFTFNNNNANTPAMNTDATPTADAAEPTTETQMPAQQTKGMFFSAATATTEEQPKNAANEAVPSEVNAAKSAEVKKEKSTEGNERKPNKVDAANDDAPVDDEAAPNPEPKTQDKSTSSPRCAVM